MKSNILLICLLIVLSGLSAQDKGITIQVHLRGVWESKISLIAISGPNSGKTLTETTSVKNGETATVMLTKDQLPGEFVLRFDYKEKETSSPYPSEKSLVANTQDLQLWINPPYCNNADSAWFQKDEIENTLAAQFRKENFKQKEQLGLLQNFLVSYTNNHSAFYRMGIDEYEKERTTYNQWLMAQIAAHKSAFVSTTFQFEYVPRTEWKDNVRDRVQNMIEHYFDQMDFKDPLILRTSGIGGWMNNYVNIYGSLSNTTSLRDSLFPLAATRAIEKARAGKNPFVYGWMVDYFYKGFETNGISTGVAALEPYFNDPDCYTSKRQQIEKRLNGIKDLLPGSQAPDFSIKDDAGAETSFSAYPTGSKYKLVLFWGAGCDHCKELIKKLYPWYQQLANKQLVKVFALSMDESETDIQTWNKVYPLLEDWKHTRPEGGINSKEANAYFILSTPVMILVDAKTNRIVAIPETAEQLDAAAK